MSKVAVIIVTHNSEQFVRKAWDALERQTKKPSLILFVDSGSTNPSYLDFLNDKPGVKRLFAGHDVGFCVGNNVGYKEIPDDFDYVLLLNPDAFLTPRFIEEAVHFMERNETCGAMTGQLLGYDIAKDAPNGCYDSTGIYRRFFGAWRDRDQGCKVKPHRYRSPEEVKAICGALMFLRKKAIGDTLFDESFYMYKEDIDLSLRIKEKGWQILFNPLLTAYHCRGWDVDRRKMPKRFRLLSAKNELKIHWKMRCPLGTVYSSCKYLAVRVFNL